VVKRQRGKEGVKRGKEGKGEERGRGEKYAFGSYLL
jgi:hypothetical protein